MRESADKKVSLRRAGTWAAVGGVLAAGAVGEVGTAAQLAAGIAGGALATGSHATKAGSRVLINTSPEPVSNWFASVGEDIAVILGLGDPGIDDRDRGEGPQHQGKQGQGAEPRADPTRQQPMPHDDLPNRVVNRYLRTF